MSNDLHFAMIKFVSFSHNPNGLLLQSKNVVDFVVITLYY